ncbi:MAG: hypothetical protein AB9915_01690 [Candidatus Dojkabacteria bacterium]
MKFFLTLFFLFFSSVGFLYYLINNQNFLPMNQIGEYDWLNIFVFVFLFLVLTFSFLSLLVFLVVHLASKEKTLKEKYILSTKLAAIVSLGLFSVLVLNFFHILDFSWGIMILFVVLIAVIVI